MGKKKIIVTGGSGFVGRNFIEAYNDKYHIIPISLRTTKIEAIDFTGVETVLHLAALVHQMKGATEEKYFDINRDLTERLAVRAKEAGVKHFVFFSTVGVYGYHGDLYNHDFILDVNSECKPNDPYGKSKYEAEEILKKLSNEEDIIGNNKKESCNKFHVAIIRPPMIYGKGAKGNMINLVKLVKKFPMLPFDYGENKRSIVSINNLLDSTENIIDNEKVGIYIPTDGEAVSIKEIVEGIALGLDKKVILIQFPRFIYKLLCKVKPSIMARLYGTLQFKGNNQPIERMNEGLRKMVGSNSRCIK